MPREFGELRVLEKLNKYEFAVELHVMREGLNRNRWDYQNIESCYESFLGQPILCAFVNGKVGDGHNMKESVDADGNPYMSFTDGTSERIVGTLSRDAKDFKIVEEDGQKWLVAKGILFSFYAKELVDNIVAKGVMEVSAETEVYEVHEGDGCEVFTNWVGLGVTILGEGVAPAIPNARIEKLAALRDEFNTVCLKAASLIDDGENEKESIGENQPKVANTKTNKGVQTLKALSKKQLASVSAKFEGYAVLAAVKDEQGVITLALMSEDGTTAIYTMGNLDEVVVLENIQKVNAQVIFASSEEGELAVDSCEMTDRLSAKLVEANTKLNETEEQLTVANNTINEMTDKEMKRRLSAAKVKAEDTLSKFNANREEKVEAKVLEAINASIENGEFSECEKDGEWTGDKEVECKVLAACAAAVMEMDKVAFDSKQKDYIWTGINSNKKREEGGVDGLLSSFGIE